MTQSNVYCTAPWKGVAVLENGDVTTCCLGSTKIGNLNQDSIEQLMSSPTFKEIQQDLIRGFKNKNCAECHRQEETIGYANLRQHFLRYYPIESLNEHHLKVIDVRWNNKCNLSCQYCTPHASSTWELKLGLPLSSVNKTYQDDLLQWILGQTSYLREIMLAGGEPMLMKQNYKLFKHAPDDCKFSIVTNLSYDLESLPCMEDLIKRPKDNVIWTISADNTHKQFEYVRNGAYWDQLVKNIKFLTHHWPHSVGLNIVYSILSATEIDSTYKTFSDLGLHKVSLLQLIENNELSVDRMPESIRKLCADRLLRLIGFHQNKFGIDQHLYPIKGIETIYENLTTANNQNIISKDLFNKKIDSFDRHSANKSFELLWPELSRLIDQELT